MLDCPHLIHKSSKPTASHLQARQTIQAIQANKAIRKPVEVEYTSFLLG